VLWRLDLIFEWDSIVAPAILNGQEEGFLSQPATSQRGPNGTKVQTLEDTMQDGIANQKHTRNQEKWKQKHHRPLLIA
jgi:hypothetical protein